MVAEIAAVAGALTSGYGAYLQGQEQAAAYKYQAQVAAQNALIARQQGDFDASRLAVYANQKIGSQISGYAASGVETTSGSALSVLRASASSAELDRLNILHGADIKAISFENQASVDNIAADNSKIAGDLGLASGALNAGAKYYANSTSGGGSTQSNQDENEFASVGGSK